MNKATKLTVGVTGHRPNRLHVGEGEVGRQLRWVMAGLKSAAQDRQLVALSAVAEGADHLFAEAALDLGCRLDVLLPFLSADYETTFEDAASVPAYRALLVRADTVKELPGALSDTKSAYQAVGRAIVDASDIMVAVWDGKPAAGRGGTLEIVEHALACRKPVVWIDACRLGLPRLIERPWAYGLRKIPVETLAGRATSLSSHKLAALIR